MRRGMIVAGVVVALVAVLAWGAVAYAGPWGRRGEKAGKLTPQERMQKLAKYLDLTAPQETAMKATLQARRAQVRAIVQDKGLPRDQKRARIIEVFKSTHDSIRALLNPDQQAKFDQLCGKIKERIKERLKDRKGKNGA